MPLTANFLADFSSLLTEAEKGTLALEGLQATAANVGPVIQDSIEQHGTAVEKIAGRVTGYVRDVYAVLTSKQMKAFVGEAIEAAQSWIQEYEQAEAAQSRLTAAMKNAGIATPELTGMYNDMAASLQKVSTFSDEAITDAQALFTVVGSVKPDAMKDTLEAAMNLAAFLKTDLKPAADMMAKAAASDGEALGKLKTILGDAYVPGMKFADVVNAINQKFGGQY